MTWIDPFDVTHERTCGGWLITFEPPPPSFEIGLVENYSEPEEYRFHFDERGGELAFWPVAGSGTVGAVVRNSAGEVVRTLASDQAFIASSCNSNPPVSRLNWDFRDDGGSLAPDGDYAITVSATDTSNPVCDSRADRDLARVEPHNRRVRQPGARTVRSGTGDLRVPPDTGLHCVVPARHREAVCGRRHRLPAARGRSLSSGPGTPRSARTQQRDVQFLVLFLDPLGRSTSTTPSSR